MKFLEIIKSNHKHWKEIALLYSKLLDLGLISQKLDIETEDTKEGVNITISGGKFRWGLLVPSKGIGKGAKKVKS
ncbi:hypothetical protein LCGC14_2888000, partial [marine sediment metagenome]